MPATYDTPKMLAAFLLSVFVAFGTEMLRITATRKRILDSVQTHPPTDGKSETHLEVPLEPPFALGQA